MDAGHPDGFTARLRAFASRRDVARVAALLPLFGAGTALAGGAEARKKPTKTSSTKHTKRRRQKSAVTHWKWYCLNGESVRAKHRGKKDRLREEGATPGKCAGGGNCTPDGRAATCGTQCGSIANNCGELVDCGVCCTPACGPAERCCAGVCTPWSDVTTFGSVADFSRPRGVALSTDTLTAWAADYDYGPITVWTRAGAASVNWTEQTTFGSNGSGDSEFKNPQGLAVSANGQTIWVADTGNSRVSIWTRPDATGTGWAFSTKFGGRGSADSQLSGPIGVWVSADTLTAWVADTNNSRICIWKRPDTSSTTWSFSAKFGGAGSAADKLSLPQGVWVSADTLTAYVADTGNNRISVWTRPDAAALAWTNLTTLGSAGSASDQFQSPIGVWGSSDALTLWVGDTSNNRVSIWTRPGAASTTWANLTTFGTNGSQADELKLPFGVVASADGREVWIADSNNNRVSIWGQLCPG
ncbi:MAG: NHL repeat-containing protein [Thermomicrobiales bacterium]